MTPEDRAKRALDRLGGLPEDGRVLGEVARPGLYKFPETSSLLEVISQVGGLTKESGDRVVVFRPGKGKHEAEAILVDAVELFSPDGIKTKNILLREARGLRLR